MLKGIYDENGNKYGGAQCICKYKELSDLYCPTSDIHEMVYTLKIPSVSEIVGAEYICDRRIFYDYNLPVYQHHKSIYPLLRGKTYHRALLQDVKMKEVTLMSKVNGTMISGTIDAYDPCTQTLYEVKTARVLPSGVRPWDFRQIQLYHWLLEKYGYPVKLYKNLYLTYENYKFFDGTPKLLPDDIVYTLTKECEKHIGIFTGQFKQAWSCAYCNYYRWCKMGIDKLKRYNPENYVTTPAARQMDRIVTLDYVLKEPDDIRLELTPEGMTIGMLPAAGVVNGIPGSLPAEESLRIMQEGEYYL